MTQLMEQIKEKDAQAFTHSGKFHADDVFSSALLLSVNPEITIHRGSQVPEDFKGIVFDIGRGKYDHHQRDSRIRENGVPYAAFGLLWEELGAEILGEELAEKFDEAFVQPLDNNDNTGEKNELATLIGNFNPPWDAQGGNDAAFFKAVGVAGMILDNKLERYRGNERADKRVEEILKQHQEEIASGKKPADEKQILVLPDYVPCQKYLSETDIAFVIFPSNRGGYCIQPQKREYSLNYKCSFPESWLGLEKEELKEDCERAKKEADREQKNYENAWAEYEMKYHKFLNEQAGILALNLEDGQPCPVCGSREHPQIAALSDEAPTQAEVELAKAERDKKEKIRDIKTEAFRKCLAGYQAAQEICLTLRKNIKDEVEDITGIGWKEKIQSLKRTLMETEKRLKQLEEIFERCRTLKENQEQIANQIEKLEEKERKTSQSLTESKLMYTKLEAEYQAMEEKLPYKTMEEAEEHLREITGKLELVRNNYETVTRCLTEKQNKEKELEGQQKTVSASVVQSQEEVQKKIRSYKQIIKEQGFEDEESYHSQCMTERELEEAEQWIEAYQKELQELEANRTLLEQQLEGKERKDTEQIAREIKEASGELEEIRKEYMKLHNTNERNREIRDNLKRNFEKNSGLQKQYEIVGNLSKTANGNLSGSAKLDFETYIQRQYFRQIIRAANKRLVRMTSGEFILQCRDVEKLGSQGQAGLDLDVYHMATDTVRDVKTLSGGESFMAALSMALGLSDIVQNTAGAIHLDTMFIDEGFGSLDDVSRDQAIRVLNDLADKDRLIGIISHVNELKEQIDHKLVVKKNEKGSSVSWSL